MVAAFVRPLAAELACEGGAGYLQVLADVYGRPLPPIDRTFIYTRNHSGLRWHKLVGPLLDPKALKHHRRLLAVRFAANELAHRAREPRKSDHRLFTSDLIDVMCGLLVAPVSAETTRITKSRSVKTA